MPPAKLEIRESTKNDASAIEQIYPVAFPDEVLTPLVQDLLSHSEITLSLVAVLNSRIAGHAIFTRCNITSLDVNISLLGPLAVLPEFQKQGIGSAILHTGESRLNDTGTELICLLGDPAYYSRFGFLPEVDIAPPFTLPEVWDGAWQSKYLGESVTKYAGTLLVPKPWNRPALWAP